MVGACSTTKPQPVPINPAPPPPALMQKADKLLPLDTANPTPKQVLSTVVANYGKYHEVSARLHALQDYVLKVVLTGTIVPTSSPE